MNDMATAFLLDSKKDTPSLIRGKPVNGTRPSGVLNNRGKLSNRVLQESPLVGTSLVPPNNSGALYLTKAFGAPGVMYKADWKSTSAFCLTYFQWGPGMWAQQEEVIE